MPPKPPPSFNSGRDIPKNDTPEYLLRHHQHKARALRGVGRSARLIEHAAALVLASADKPVSILR